MEPDVLDKEYIEWASQLPKANTEDSKSADSSAAGDKGEGEKDGEEKAGTDDSGGPPAKKKKPDPSMTTRSMYICKVGYSNICYVSVYDEPK